jgi:hypothetical protein
MSDLAGYLYWSVILLVGSVQMGKKSVRTIGNFNGINPGCGDARKKFAYNLYFGYDKTKLNLCYILSQGGIFFTTISRSIRVMFQF